MNPIICSRCGKENKAGNTFCIGCGQKLEIAVPPSQETIPSDIVCLQCGKKNKPGSSFCIECGTPFETAGQSKLDTSANLCPQCRKPLVEDSAFCVYCGSNVDRAPSPVRPAVVMSSQQRPTQTKGGVLGKSTYIPTWLVIAIAVVIIALVALLLFTVFKPSNSSNVNQAPVSATSAATSGESASSAGAASTSGDADVASNSVSSAAAQSATAQGGSYVLADSDSRYYSRAELEKLSTLDLYHARNEIYARHGRGFKNEDLRTFFGAKSWYRETISPEAFNESVLNEYEKANANLMLEIEKSRNSPYLG